MTSKQQQWWIQLKNPVYSGKTFFDYSVNTGQIDMGFGVDTPEKNPPCLKIAKDGRATFIFWGICFKSHANLNSINGTNKESLTCIEGF